MLIGPLLILALAVQLQPGVAPVATTASAQVPYQPRILSQQDASLFAQGLAQARAGDVIGTEEVMSRIGDPTARLIVKWALIDVAGDHMSFSSLQADRDALRNWPRAESRIRAQERTLETSGLPPQQIIAWFGDEEPQTVWGAIALAQALDAAGRGDQARVFARQWWRERVFDLNEQERFLARFGGWLTRDDHERRLDTLLYDAQGPAMRAMLPLVSDEWRALAEARVALRNGSGSGYVAGSLADHPGLAVERARRARLNGRESEGFAELGRFPPAPQDRAGQNLLWTERRNYFIDALQAGNGRAAYEAMAGHGFTSGERAVDAEFFAGWAALRKLNDPVRAAQHFDALRRMSSTPITQGRAYYWLGRAADAAGNRDQALAYWREGGQHIHSFYGQLAAQAAGVQQIRLPSEPEISAQDQARFEAYPLVRAARLLAEADERPLMRVFVMELDGQLERPADLALLVDLSRDYGDQDLSLHVGRTAGQKGVVLPERAYPIRSYPTHPMDADEAFVLAITRQESAFDPRARSSADARGMMQLLPSTARGVAGRMGVPWSESRLWDADYNMQLGAYHLGEMLQAQNGSYLLTAVAYNAGPARPPQWIPYCGDPRDPNVDALDFIECVPFTETRNYMMRVMENRQVYQARLNGGTARLSLLEDIERGSFGPRPYDSLR
ncbi:lytic transglycosylase domain-containing protein [Brevundimonas sp. 2R-24]|uniref:Lytic transglycosylase domain-containing protein n=1 Tax=Peiella sedimenti TaxID=3061083 RepID=A0ABT8SPZ2_9CAUL|nr:lytic transglycosylase domain-containing protein [Caulobacteraceae bacterium XZ-24]